jgi:hypothetical protein
MVKLAANMASTAMSIKMIITDVIADSGRCWQNEPGYEGTA